MWGQRGALYPSPPWRWQLAWLFFSRQPVFQEVRMGSSPRSPSLCPVTSPLPALGQPAAADDRCDETVVVTPPGDSPGAEEDSPPGVQEQAHRSPCPRVLPLPFLPTLPAGTQLGGGCSGGQQSQSQELVHLREPGPDSSARGRPSTLEETSPPHPDQV